ncbi:glycosyltransferase family 39 protein [Leptolyngbya sp. FACHB-36]|uniref:glycosyltransferase family 39 protein n=1 Tax=Leptolyngbya sp. FACHB-36 TaxID=2692808 RepID=UPI001680D740|nr:glycosyltransferase family 39 protein [Leptolyngbya sp. FACHB-36]
MLRKTFDWNNFGKLPGTIDRWIDFAWTIGLLLAALLLFVIDLGWLPLRDWDEGIVAQVARDIWRSSFDSLTWLYPTQAGEPYFNKPPLVHWLIALTYQVGGVSEWTTRLPGAILTAVSVPLLYMIGRELFPLRAPAIFASLVYLTLLPVVRHGRLAMLDGALLCFFLLLMLCLLRTRRDLRWGLGVGIAFGLLCMTKGIVALLLGAIAIAFIAWDTPRLLTAHIVWLGVLIGSMPAALWYFAQWWHYDRAFVQSHLLNQSLDRVWSSVENNQGPLWYYVLEILKLALPWLLFLPQGFRFAWEHRTMGWAKLALVWSGGYLLAISLMGTKLPWYVLPVYPALALVTGVQLAKVWNFEDFFGGWRKRERRYPVVWSLVFGGLAIITWAASVYFGRLDPVQKPDLQLILTAVALTLTVAAVLIARHDSQFIAVLIWGTYVSLMMLVSSQYWVWELGEQYPVKPVAAIVRQHTPPGQTVWTSYKLNRPSLNFYSDRRVVPASIEDLRRHWQQDAAPYLLVDRSALQALQLPSAQQLNQAEGWQLLTRLDK